MFKKTSIIMAIVFAIILTSIAFAGNNKTEAGSGINPASMSDKPGFDNGNAWWKNNECVEIVDSLETSVDQLQTENDALKAEIEELKEEVRLASIASDTVEEAEEMESVKFTLQKHSSTHPNSPNAAEIYMLLRTYDEHLTQLIMNSSSGEYEVSVKILTPNGEEINVYSTLEALEQPYPYRDHFVRVVR